MSLTDLLRYPYFLFAFLQHHSGTAGKIQVKACASIRLFYRLIGQVMNSALSAKPVIVG